MPSLTNQAKFRGLFYVYLPCNPTACLPLLPLRYTPIMAHDVPQYAPTVWYDTSIHHDIRLLCIVNSLLNTCYRTLMALSRCKGPGGNAPPPPPGVPTKIPCHTTRQYQTHKSGQNYIFFKVTPLDILKLCPIVYITREKKK